MSDETTPQAPEPKTTAAEGKPTPAQAAAAEGEKPAKVPKKEKAPGLEDKPFNEFVTQDYLPAITQTLAKMGIQDLDLKFEQSQLPILEMDNAKCWQVIGHWQGGQRQFHIIFSKEDIQAPKFFCYADNGAQPSTLESFMIDERKINLDLLLLYTVQRLNGQKWLVRN
ncbi:MAG: DUF2996 domain-containing protein [Leptolyngbyaceae cyanobacterium CRU_2_3]|nr:DUF2996 domain-containing protein [Leptolyngbyaceae cyanobacterium CRU_2_3]